MEWIAFARVRGPIGGRRADAYAVMQAAFSSGRPVSSEQFLPWTVEPRTESDDDNDMYVPSAEERAWAAAMA